MAHGLQVAPGFCQKDGSQVTFLQFCEWVTRSLSLLVPLSPQNHQEHPHCRLLHYGWSRRSQNQVSPHRSSSRNTTNTGQAKFNADEREPCLNF